MTWMEFLKKAFMGSRAKTLAARLEQSDKEYREVKHDLKNVQTNVDILKTLVEKMRDGEHAERHHG